MKALGFEPVETLLPSTDFVAFARSMGADGVVVEHEDELEGALARAMRHEGPFVVDVRIDPTEINPVLASRVASLERQSTNPEKETK